MVCSVEQLVLGNEIIGMTRRFLRGFEMSRQALARDVIASVGPAGNYLMTEHTLHHFQGELWRPKVFTRDGYKRWEEAGAKDTPTRVREKIQQILETHQPPALDDKILANLEEIKKRGEKELAR